MEDKKAKISLAVGGSEVIDVNLVTDEEGQQAIDAEDLIAKWEASPTGQKQIRIRQRDEQLGEELGISAFDAGVLSSLRKIGGLFQDSESAVLFKQTEERLLNDFRKKDFPVNDEEMRKEPPSKTGNGQLPAWAEELVSKYKAGIADVFLLHQNVQDYVGYSSSLRSFLAKLLISLK